MISAMTLMCKIVPDFRTEAAASAGLNQVLSQPSCDDLERLMNLLDNE